MASVTGNNEQRAATVLVTFKTHSHADITMFGDVSQELLKMMGQSGNVPGAIMADDLPAALTALQDALAVHGDEDTAAVADDEMDEGAKVSLGLRAKPLLEMLQAAIAAGDNVMWDEH